MNEFTGLKMTPDHLNVGVGGVFPGEKVLERMGMTHTIKQTLLAQAGITLTNYIFTCVMLHLQTSGKNTLELPKRSSQPHEDKIVGTLDSGNSDKKSGIFLPPRV